MRECFVGVVGEEEDPEAGNAGNQGNLPTGQPPVVPAGSPTGGNQHAQAAQLDNLEAKIEEDRRDYRAMHTALAGGHGGREPPARQVGRVAQARITADDDANGPATLTRTSQKLVVAVALLRAMPEPSTPEGRNLRIEAQMLVEQAAVQHAESSAPRMRQTSSKKGGST